MPVHTGGQTAGVQLCREGPLDPDGQQADHEHSQQRESAAALAALGAVFSVD